MKIADLRQRLRAHGARPGHEERVLRNWTRALPLDEGRSRPEDFFPLELRKALPALAEEWRALARLRAEHAGEDGTKLLLELADGQTVESVLLPRGGLCVSTQVGCAVGCTFCMTGRDGLLRQLGSAEIVAQVALARSKRPVKKVVFMGMGEPAHNLDNVLDAIELLGRLGDIGHKNLVFSTVGDRRVFERLPRCEVKPGAGAVAAHDRCRTAGTAPAARAAHRSGRAGRTRRIYARETGYPIQYQWTLLEGVNDGDAEVDGIARLLAGKYAVMNLIPWNAVDGLGYRRPSRERAEAMSLALYKRGILTKLRQSAGQDVDGGCGQLRARTLARQPRPAAG